MGLRGPKPKQTINTSWTPELAYVVGLIATDGCLYGDGRHISFTTADLQLAQLFKELLKLPNKIRYKSGSVRGRMCPDIQFGSIIFYQWLLSIGLTPRKSKTIGPLLIPDEYFFDFIRGCFDGDGTIYSYMDPRWANSHMFYVSFASASPSFVNWVRTSLARLVCIKGHITPVQKNTHQLRYAKAESLVLLSKMYYNKQVNCLERKRQKAIKILKTHYEIQLKNPRIFLARSAKIDI